MTREIQVRANCLGNIPAGPQYETMRQMLNTEIETLKKKMLATHPPQVQLEKATQSLERAMLRLEASKKAVVAAQEAHKQASSDVTRLMTDVTSIQQ